MRFLIDENVPLLVATALRSIGHDCFAVAESAAQAVDVDLLALARHERRVLVTFPAPPGVVDMRSRPENAELVSESFVALFRDGRIDPMSHFVTIDTGGIIRSTPLEQQENG